MHPKIIFACLAIVSCMAACSKKEVAPPPYDPPQKLSYPPGTFNPVVIRFHFMFGDDSLKYGKSLAPGNGDSISISKFKFLLTRIKTIHQDSSTDLLFRAAVDAASPTFSFYIG